MKNSTKEKIQEAQRWLINTADKVVQKIASKTQDWRVRYDRRDDV